MSLMSLRLIALGLAAAAIAVTAVLVGLGTPVPLALTLGLLVVAVVTFAVERRLARQAPVLGITMLSLSGLAGIAAAVHALPQVNGWIVGLATLALEVAAVYGAVVLYRRTLRSAGTLARRRLATRRGWRYEAEATVPVPGPRTAPRLASVPNQATSTTGRDVLHGSSNGLAATVFDRVDARGRLAQTVWLVNLPAALPFVAPGDQTDDPELAGRLLTDEVRRTAASLGFPVRWWVEGRYLCCTLNQPAGPALVEGYVDRLTGLASRFPWPALTR